MRCFPTSVIAVATSMVMLSAAPAEAGMVTFGSGANAFQMEFVTIGSPGNAADTGAPFNPTDPLSFFGLANPNPAGAVAYTYQMGKFEVSRDMVTKANAAGSLGLTLDSMSFVTGGPRADMPATGLSWFEAARFVNWLNTSQGFHAAYKFDSSGVFQLWQAGDMGFDPLNPFRNSLANFVLPSTHEWYKAAYYDPVTETYFNFPTGSDAPPTPVASGTGTGTAVYAQLLAQGPADVMLAGGLSPFGTMGQGGNVFELEETEFDLVNNLGSAHRGFRGGNWISGTAVNNNQLVAAYRTFTPPTFEGSIIGFRVVNLSAPTDGPAEVPEPSSLALIAIGSLTVGGLGVRRRTRADR